MTIWTCRNCDNKDIHHQGVPQHRAMHRRRQDHMSVSIAASDVER